MERMLRQKEDFSSQTYSNRDSPYSTWPVELWFNIDVRIKQYRKKTLWLRFGSACSERSRLTRHILSPFFTNFHIFLAQHLNQF
jgi:hypothetical protein